MTERLERDFSIEEYAARQARLRQVLADKEIDLLIVLSPVNLNYLIGVRAKSFQKFQCLLFTLEDKPLTFFTRRSEVAECADWSVADEVRGWNGGYAEDPIEALGHLLREKRLAGMRTAIEVPAYYLSVADHAKLKALLGDALVLESNDIIEPLKFVKSPAEIAHIREASRISDEAMQAAMAAIAPGVPETDVAAIIYATMIRNGAGAPVSAINFACGENSCYAHPQASTRAIEAGDFMHIEYGTSYRQYTSTLGRQLCCGAPTARMVEIYGAMRAACDAAIAEIRAGVPATRPHEAAVAVIADAGFDAYRLHLTGYGVAPGFPPTWNEAMWMFDGSEHVLEAGMVVSVEPPIFIHEERLGARIVDNVLVHDEGCEVLSTVSRDLLLVG